MDNKSTTNNPVITHAIEAIRATKGLKVKLEHVQKSGLVDVYVEGFEHLPIHEIINLCEKFKDLGLSVDFSYDKEKGHKFSFRA